MTKQTTGRRVWWRVVVVVTLVAIGGLGWRMMRRQAIVAESIPLRPTLDARSAEFGFQLTHAEETARGYFQSEAGLASLSRLYHANGFYQEAMGCYQGLQRLEPREARWLHLPASILAGFGQIDEALPLWQRTIALVPDYLPARIRLGDILTKANRTAEATKAYAEALVRDPENPYALLGLARADIIRGDWVKAREHLQSALKSHPDFIGALSLLVTVQEYLGDKNEARVLQTLIGRKEYSDISDPWLDELTDDCYDPYRLSVAAAVARLARNPVAARSRLERAVALAPEVGSYHRQLGQLLFQLRDYIPARRQLEIAVAAAPADSDAWLLLVDLLMAMGASGEAERALAAGLSACPQSAALHYAYGHRLSGAGRYPEAMVELKSAKQLRPNEANAYVDLALVYFGLERIEEGIAELKGAIAVQPGHALALQVLARYAINSEDEPAARQWLRQLRQQSRGSDDDLNAILKEYQQHFSHLPW